MSEDAHVDTSEIEHVPLARLRFDARNPRLIAEPDAASMSQSEAASRLLDDHDPIAIARSMARYGFFPSDPLIVHQIGDDLEVLEGNRRLLAARLLTDAELREELDADDEYAKLANSLSAGSHDLSTIPVQIVGNRADASAVIGFRHIVGIKRWPAYEKAAFVARLLEEIAGAGSADPFADVSVLTGEDASDIKRYVRNFRALRQAKEGGVDVSSAQEHFGAFTYALGVRNIAGFIGLITPSAVSTTTGTFFTAGNDRFRLLIELLFGSTENEAVVTDSRRYPSLGRVLAHEQARARLLETRRLDDALEFTSELHDRTLKEIRRAITAISNANDAVADGKLTVGQDLWDELASLRENLNALIDAIGSPAASSATTNASDEGPDIEDEFDDDEADADAYGL